jgi:arsenical pump membrane protein
MPPLASHVILIWIISLASILCMLLRPWRIPEAAWIGGGALLLIVTGLIPLRLAARGAGKGSDVYFFLTGMMLLAELARHEGVFDWVCAPALKVLRTACARRTA